MSLTRPPERWKSGESCQIDRSRKQLQRAETLSYLAWVVPLPSEEVSALGPPSETDIGQKRELCPMLDAIRGLNKQEY